MRFTRDATWRRIGPRTLLGGSPLRRFDVTEAGARVLRRLEADEAVEPNELTTRLVDAGALHPVPPATLAAPHVFGPEDVTVVTPQLGGAAHGDGRITVDDGSVPPIADASVRLATNRGPAAARNEGRRHVATPLIAFVDTDVSLLDIELATHGGAGWLDALLPHFDDPTVGLVAPRVMGDPHSSLDLGAEPARIRGGTRVSYVPAAAIVVRVDAFDDVGGFDEALRVGEDVDLVWRLDEAGWRCRYEPTSAVWHRPRSTWRARLAQQVAYGSSSAPLALRHPLQLAPWRGDPVVATVWVLVGFGHPLGALIAGLGHVERVRRRLSDIPRAVAGRLAVTSLVHGGRQAATAIRRAWWPIAIAASLVSRRARRATLVAVMLGGRSAPTDVAFGWGVWKGMIRLRTWRPIIPTFGRR